MLNHFFKYQSLGNDFIFFDWYKKTKYSVQKVLSQSNWKQFIIDSCQRNFGIGADGILILKNNEELNLPEGLIFNSDGSQAELCLNGLRCLALHLYSQHNFAHNFNIKMGSKIINCDLKSSETSSINANSVEIITKIEKGDYQGIKTIEILGKKIEGHVVNVGNPHFIILQKVELDWLRQNGNLIEKHEIFENKTNVEFIWPDNQTNNFNMLVYERGCGITLACSSGAAATLYALFSIKNIKPDEKITLKMLGGKITGWIDSDKNIYLQSRAQLVFKGETP